MTSEKVTQPNSAKPKVKRLVRTAYHEAGHACVASALIGTPEVVSIKGKNRSLGNCLTAATPCTPGEFIAQLALAGLAAEHLLTDQVPISLKFFLVNSDATLSVLGDDDDLSVAADTMKELHGVRSHKQRILRIKQYYEMARDSLRSVWPIVNTVATTLLAKKTLKRDELISIIEAGDVYGPIFAVQEAYGLTVGVPPNAPKKWPKNETGMKTTT